MTTVRDLSALDGTHATVFPGAEPRTVRLALDAGERVDRHSHPGRDVVFLVIEGAVELTVGDETLALGAGQAARFDGERDVSPLATEACTALVVLAPRAGDG
jgi:quercetin dioxygenase-like cupin family protein